MMFVRLCLGWTCIVIVRCTL